MKKFLLRAAFFALLAVPCSAFQIPQEIHNLGELEKAQTTAITKARPLVFVISVKTMKET